MNKIIAEKEQGAQIPLQFFVQRLKRDQLKPMTDLSDTPKQIYLDPGFQFYII